METFSIARMVKHLKRDSVVSWVCSFLVCYILSNNGRRCAIEIININAQLQIEPVHLRVDSGWVDQQILL